MEKTIKRSLKLLLLEEIAVVLKEINFIDNILEYFYGYEEQKTNKEQSRIYHKETIRKLKKDVKPIKWRLLRLVSVIEDKMKESDNVYFSIYYDYVKIQIEELLLLIEALYLKMNQFFGETLNQYIPYPTFFGRRYSSHALMMFINFKYKKMFKTLIGKKEENVDRIVFSWTHRTGFKRRILRNRNVYRKNYKFQTHNDYIDLPYWYYELSFMIPAITHEIITLSLHSKYKNSVFYDGYKDFKEKIEKFFNDRTNCLVKEVSEVLGYNIFINDMVKDIYSDVIAFKLHGVSYLYTLFHVIFANNLSRDFLKIVYDERDIEKKDIKNPFFKENDNNDSDKNSIETKEYFKDVKKEDIGEFIKEYEIEFNEWFFSYKRDINILRIYILLSLVDSKDKNDKIKEIEELLQSIMPLKEDKEIKKDSFLYYLQNHQSAYNTYTVIQTFLTQLYNVVIKYFEKNKLKLKKDVAKFRKNFDASEKIRNLSDEYKDLYEKLWEERFEVIEKDLSKKSYLVPHKGYFRRLIHQKFSGFNFDKNKNDKCDSDDNMMSLLVFRKVRKDFKVRGKRKNDSIKTMNKFFENYLKTNEKALIVYGLYDYVYLIEREKCLDIFEELKERFLENDFLSQKYNKKFKYFEAKNVLMKIYEINKGINWNDKDKFTMIVNMELKKNINEPNGYQDLKGTIDEIKKNLKENRLLKATIFKSLGPKDVVVILQHQNINLLFKIVSNFYKIENINRTFSIFASHFDLLKSCKSLSLSKNINLISYIRAPKIAKIDKRIEEKIKKYKNFIKSAYKATGVMDYKIEWRKNLRMVCLFCIYNNLLSYMTDYQTKIEQKIDLK